jgi:hypothetical protein
MMVTGFENSLCLDIAAIVMIPAWLMLLLSFCFRRVRWLLRLPAISGIVGYLVGYVDLQNRPVILQMTNLGARNAFEGLSRLIGPVILGEILGTLLMIFGLVVVAVSHRVASRRSSDIRFLPAKDDPGKTGSGHDEL